jgi:uncharacterized membrane protein YhaH (DUF805 family)
VGSIALLSRRASHTGISNLIAMLRNFNTAPAATPQIVVLLIFCVPFHVLIIFIIVWRAECLNEKNKKDY